MIHYIWDNIFKKGTKSRTISDVLSENFLFKNLTKSELKFIKDIVHERHYRVGEPIFRQGEIGVGMYIIAKGSVDISVLDHNTNETERQIHVTRLIEGDFFGELSLVEDSGRRSATAIAAEDSVLIGFFKPDLMEVLERSPSSGVKIVLRLAEVLGRRLKETTEKVSQLKTQLKIITNPQGSKNAKHSNTPD